MNSPSDHEADEDGLAREGEALQAAIETFVSGVYDHEAPTLVTRFVVVAEADDGRYRWVEALAFGADGRELPEWESLGLLEYARRVVRRDSSSCVSDEETDDE